MKKTFVIIGVVIFVLLLLVGGWIIKVTIAPAKAVIEKTVDADNIILNYEYFKKQFRDVEAIGKKITHQENYLNAFNKSAGPRKDWTFEDKNEHARISSIVTGLRDQRSDMISDYNAKANMANRKIFMGKDCPQQIQQK